jgi:hypothetical protein
MINAMLAIVLAIVCATSTFMPAFAASIKNVYFSNGQVVPGQRYTREGELPGPTKEFTKGKDKVARLFIIFRDLSAHKLGGELKTADGKVVSRLNRQLDSFTGSGNVNWRFTTHSFNLETREPGEYQFELFVDGDSAGTYTFTLR